MAVLCFVVLAGCGSDEQTQTGSQQPSTAASPPASPGTASALEGTWRTDPISPGDAEATLQRFGLAKWIKRFRTVTPLEAETVLILDLREGEWDLYGKRRGRPREEIDYDAAYMVTGERVDKVHSTGVTTYRWSVDGGALTLEWLESTEPTSQGIPDEVFSRVLYMTQEFKRQD